jgi:hypothetical protein
MMVWVVMIHVSCSGAGWAKGIPKDCTSDTAHVYRTEQECKWALDDRLVPYLGPPEDLFCQMRIKADKQQERL